MSKQLRENWSGQTMFVLAAVGSAIGVGNIWKFPYITGVNGGGAFVLVYLAFLVAIGLPLLIAEMTIGRAGGNSGAMSIQALAHKHKRTKLWGFLSYFAVLTAFLLMSYYSTIGGWLVSYLADAMTGALAQTSDGAFVDRFVGLRASGPKSILFHVIFMVVTGFIAYFGIRGGLEFAIKLSMPLLAFLLIALGITAAKVGAPGAALEFLFKPDFSSLTGESVLEALGHSFFTLGVGLGVMVVYGSYLKPAQNIVNASVIVIAIDTIIALVAGFIVFSVVFSAGADPQAGPGLIFITLPELFYSLPAGAMISAAFFLLMAIAAWTSAISILEVMVSFTVDKFNVDRRKAVIGITLALVLFGMPAAMSANYLSELQLIGSRDVFDSLDYFVSNWALPIGGLGLIIFSGWFIWSEIQSNLELTDRKARVLKFTMRYVAPIGVLIAFLNLIGAF